MPKDLGEVFEEVGCGNGTGTMLATFVRVICILPEEVTAVGARVFVCQAPQAKIIMSKADILQEEANSCRNGSNTAM